MTARYGYLFSDTCVASDPMDLKKITTIVRSDQLEDVETRLKGPDVPGITVDMVKGYGEYALLGVAMAFGTTGAWAGPTTLTGTVGDAMCGPTHMVKGDDAKCTRLCVKGKAEYALIVDGKAYTLKGDVKIKAQLDKLAARKVVVTGTQKDSVVEVTSVRAAR